MVTFLWASRAQQSIPTPEHYLPLLYTLGAAYDDEPVSFFNDEIAFKSISMLGVSIGHAQPGGGVAIIRRHLNSFGKTPARQRWKHTCATS